MTELEVLLHWVYVAIMVGSGISFYVMSKKPRKIPYYKYTIHIFIVIWSALGYSALALNQGTIVVFDQVVHYARYLDWIVTTPLLLLSLCLTAKLTTRNEEWLIGTLLGTQVIMIVTGLVAELSANPTYQYFWYIIGCIALVVILYIMWNPLLRISKTQGKGIEKVYVASAVYLSVQWVLYPIVWLIGQPGIQAIDSFTTTLLFLILPVVSKAGFGFFNLIKLRNLDDKYKPAPKPPHPSKPSYEESGQNAG
jgi:bacteriorhodopsin